MYSSRSNRFKHPRRKQSEDDVYGRRQFACDSCEKRFDRRHDLKRHAKLHQGIMDYRCEYCGRQFAQRNGLDVHILTHLGIRILQCPQKGCEVKPFRDESSYRRHWMKFHSPTPPEYFCNRCSHKTSRKSLLAGHMKTQHNGASMPMHYRVRKERGSSPAVPPAIKVKVYDSELDDERDIRASNCSSTQASSRPLPGAADFVFVPTHSSVSDNASSSRSSAQSSTTFVEEEFRDLFACTVTALDSSSLQLPFSLVPSYPEYVETQYPQEPIMPKVYMDPHHVPTYAGETHGFQYYSSFNHPPLSDPLNPCFAPWSLSTAELAALEHDFMGLDLSTGDLFGVEGDLVAGEEWEDYIIIDPALRNTK